MPSAKSRKKWNKEHYTQINVAAPKVLAEGFKATCARDGVSVAGAINSFMRERIGFTSEPRKATANAMSVGTRAHRRKQVYDIIIALEAIRDAEEAYLERIPENLQCSTHADAAANSISALSDAIEILEDTY